MLNNLDITMTATIRPEVINLTLKSFFKRFLHQFDSTRLIINIDPIGDESHTVDDVILVCKRYFKTIIVNTPKTASFPKAVKWCWEQVESEYFLHLEDDWLLKKIINKDLVLKLMCDDTIKSIRFFLSRNSKFNLIDESYCYSNAFSLNPSIMRKDFIEDLLLRFDINLDPEKQFSDIDSNSNSKIKFILYGEKSDGYFTIDIGTKWRKFLKFEKPNISLSKTKSWNRKALSPRNVKDFINYKIHMFYWEHILT